MLICLIKIDVLLIYIFLVDQNNQKNEDQSIIFHIPAIFKKEETTNTRKKTIKTTSHSPNLSNFHNLILTMSAIPLPSFIWNFIIKLKVRIYDREPPMVIKANVKSETFPRLTCSHCKSLTPVVAKISITW
ncbi:hypothetical protein Droror1_Dr00025848 [Drosera rotundifolia]